MIKESANIQYSSFERQFLLSLARESVAAAAAFQPPPTVDSTALSTSLSQPRACFVTLHSHGELRGCTGVLIPRSPLAVEVIHTAAQSARCDPRFSPVVPDEVPLLEIEISVLTLPQKIAYGSPQDLIRKIRPGIDGVTLSKGPYKATFLPQVWEKVPDPTDFFGMLCEKMGLPRSSWKLTPLAVEIYQVEEFSEVSEAPLDPI